MLRYNRDEGDREPTCPVFYSFLCPSVENQPPLCTSFDLYVYVSSVVWFFSHILCSLFTYVYIYRSTHMCAYMCIYSCSYRPSTFIFKYCFVFLHMNIPWFLLILSHNKNCQVFLGFLICCWPWQVLLQKEFLRGLLAVHLSSLDNRMSNRTSLQKERFLLAHSLEGRGPGASSLWPIWISMKVVQHGI